MDRRLDTDAPEKLRYTKYYEHDGALRAYANRMMWFGISAVMISFVLALLFFWVRVQPPTVIRIAANGDATVVSGVATAPRGADRTLVRAPLRYGRHAPHASARS